MSCATQGVFCVFLIHFHEQLDVLIFAGRAQTFPALFSTFSIDRLVDERSILFLSFTEPVFVSFARQPLIVSGRSVSCLPLHAPYHLCIRTMKFFTS